MSLWFEELKKEKDACYYKVRSRYKKWPSAYASGALVQCRKVGAKNWGNSVKKSADDIRLALSGRIVRLYLSKPIRTLNQFRKRIGNAPEGARKHLQENAKAQEEKINNIQDKYKTELEQANNLERLLAKEGKKLPEGVISIAAEQIEHFGLDALEEEVDYIIQRRLK